MISSTVAMVVIIVVLVITSGSIAFLFFLKWLAEENIFFTTVLEGTAKAIMRGKKVKGFIMAFSGYHLNDPAKKWFDPTRAEWEIINHVNKEGPPGKDDYYDDRPWILRHLGLYWVGWPWSDSVYVYAFEWNETYTDQQGKEQILPRADATDFIYVADFTYAIVTESAETKDLLPTEEHTFVTVAIRNPYRALFSGEDWMRRITAAINRHVRTFVGEKLYADLISVSKDDLTDFSGSIILLSERLPDDRNDKPPYGLQSRYGVEIRTADLQTIELSGDAKKQNQEASTEAYVAEQKATAARKIGQAEADVIRMKGEQEADALDKRLLIINKHGPAGIALAGYDAVQESSKGPGNTVVWANNPLTAIAGMFNHEVKKRGEK